MIRRLIFLNYWSKRKVPEPNKNSIFGSYQKFVLNEGGPNEVKWMYDLFIEYKYFGLINISEYKLFICDPDLIERVLEKDFDYFKSEESKNTIQINDFTSDDLKNIFHIIERKSVEFKSFIKVTEVNKSETECVGLISKFVAEIICSYVYGIEMDSMLESERKKLQNLFETKRENILMILIKYGMYKCANMINLKLDTQNETFHFKKVKQTNGKTTNEQQNHADLNNNDFINFLLENNENPKSNNPPLNEKFATEQIFTFLSSSLKTTSCLCGFVLHELAYNWKVQEKVHREIESVLDRYNGELSYDAISEMAYLEMVVLEGMRMYPPLPALTRICRKPYELPGSDLVVDVGMKIIIPIYGIHRSPEFYPNPDKFVPERFVKEEIEKRHRMTYIPIGDESNNKYCMDFFNVFESNFFFI